MGSVEIYKGSYMSGAVASAWSDAECPQHCLDVEGWALLFEWAGYTHDGEPADRPTEAVELFRGRHPDGRFGMSWTIDLEMARRFAYAGFISRKAGHVFAAVVQPEHLLAYIGEYTRGESEFVVDPDGLSDANVRLLGSSQK